MAKDKKPFPFKKSDKKEVPPPKKGAKPPMKGGKKC